MYLFFDTETTGLPRSWKAPLHNLDNWPRMVQLAYKYFDKSGLEIESGNFIIKPEGFTIPKEASNIHGITTEIALTQGILLREVLDIFLLLVKESSLIIAHNIAFDEKIICAEYLREGYENPLHKKETFCTMKATTNFCALVGNYGYKWPTLAELHKKLFKKGFDNAHDASVDIEITAKCFWELKRRGII